MPRLQHQLERLLSTVGDVSDGQVANASALVLRLGPLRQAVHEIYQALGGIQDAPVIRPGNWDIEFDGVAVELDEQLHFNAYRALTLQSDLYKRVSGFPLLAYRRFCDDYLRDCIRAGSHGRRWTSPGSEAQFGRAGPIGQLTGSGAPRWKQRAFYDFIKDAVSLVSDVPVVRLSIWEPVPDDAQRTIGQLIDKPGAEAARLIADLIRCRTDRLGSHGATGLDRKCPSPTEQRRTGIRAGLSERANPTKPTSAMSKDIQIYCECMERVRHHLSVTDAVVAGKINTGSDDLNGELIFLHLRKALEEMAFSSLAANREKYSAARAKFAADWRAKGVLEHVAKVNPQFWPIPVTGPTEVAPGHKHLDRVKAGFLTRDEFVVLYDAASVLALHTPNPYAPAGEAVDPKYSADAWSARIKTLLTLHCVKLVDISGLWVVRVGNDGPVEALTAVADGDFVVEPAQ